MKHPSRSTEAFEFNLGQAPMLRCASVGAALGSCGSCESCLLLARLTPVKDWFAKAGDQSRRRFVLGLVRRLHSSDLLDYIVGLLAPLLGKDFTYARTRTQPSLDTDRGTMSADRALNTFDLDRKITSTWYWFQSTNYWTKSNFLLSLLRDCESHLLHLVGVQARTLLASEKKACAPEDDYESSSVAPSYYTYETSEHPELELLRSASRSYSRIDADPFTDHRPATASDLPATRTTPAVDEDVVITNEVFNDDSGDEGFADGAGSTTTGGESTMMGGVDPTCLVIATSAKAHAGVARYKDFIGGLPVHLAKHVLGMLDQVSLHNCVCVCKKWRALVEEVHKEYFVQQHLWEDVMLMQGSAAQGCNPVYAKDIDVTVPNLEEDSFRARRTDGDVIQTTFKSEVSFTTAYSGFSTRRIIMEERNVYCGAYNVMVLVDRSDASRVVHTDGGKLIALGFHDRKVRFINSETGKEVGPVISGHAGSVRCVALNEKGGYVLSGSYDTSIRCWSLESGKCQKIYRGHRDTITCLEICGERFVSGAKDKYCKVWQVATGKCLRTFKHRHPVVAVTLSEELCISGCEGGKVKVWDMKTGALIKKLTGHHGPVTGIKFDRWHIVTASKDGYALAWSSQGDHQRCLSAFRHPKEVLSVEFMYLRVVTGCADGKLRIWNMVTGDCLRIMRGNSRSDPITTLIAIGNRVTLNTPNNLLVFNFEPIEYDYTLESDKMPPLVQYGQYSDAPTRQHAYPYIRAQRMARAGATNTKIIYHDGRQPETTFYRAVRQPPQQVPHSAKTLSKKSLQRARSIQSASLGGATSRGGDSAYESMDGRESRRKDAPHGAEDGGGGGRGSRAKGVVGAGGAVTAKLVCVSDGRPPLPGARPTTAKSRATSVKSGTQSAYSVAGFQLGRPDDDSDITDEDEGERQRRVSWAFEHPSLPPRTKELDLGETKSLLRSQIRARGDVVPPDFIYLTVNAIQASMRAAEASKNMEANRRDMELQRNRQLGRPSSSPSRIDPRTRLPLDELGVDDFLLPERGGPATVAAAAGTSDALSVAESRVTQGSKRARCLAVHTAGGSGGGGVGPGGAAVPTKTVYVRDFDVTALQPADKNFVSIHPQNLKSSIPKGQVVRPHTTSPTQGMASADGAAAGRGQRPVGQQRSKSVGYTASSTGSPLRPCTARTVLSSSSSTATTTAAAGAGSPRRAKKYHGFTTSATQPSVVPMLMYPKDMNAYLEQLKTQRQERLEQAAQRLVAAAAGGGGGSETVTTTAEENTAAAAAVGAVSQYTNPFRPNSELQLRTYQQVDEQVHAINHNHEEQQRRLKESQEKRQRQLWLNKVRGQMKRDQQDADKPPKTAKKMVKKG